MKPMNPTPTVMRTPRSVDIDITARCNLRCRYCYFFDNPALVYRELPTEEWLRFFDELGRCGVMDVTIAGGEPFIRRDLPQLLEGIVRNRMRFALLSNGGLITDEIAGFLARTGRCNYVQISIDGASAETHDSCRGQGAFAGALRGLETLRRNGVHVAVRVTLHHYNVGDLENTARFLLEELGLPSFGVNSAGYLGSCRLHADEIQLTTADRQLAMETLLRLAEQYPGRIQAQAGPLAEGRMWREMEQARVERRETMPGRGTLTGCGCPNSKIAIPRGWRGLRPATCWRTWNWGASTRIRWRRSGQQHPALVGLRTRHRIPLSQFEFLRRL